MPMRIVLISLLLLRGLLGPACGQPSMQVREASDCCCCCEGAGTCSETDLPLACILCAACEGRVPMLPPATDSRDPGFRAILDEPALPNVEFSVVSAAAPMVEASQIVAGTPWCERLRPTICIWTI